MFCYYLLIVKLLVFQTILSIISSTLRCNLLFSVKRLLRGLGMPLAPPTELFNDYRIFVSA